MPEAQNQVPSLAEILRDDPLYLDAAVNTKEASRITGVPIATLETLRCRGGGPVFVKLNKTVRYTRRALIEWLASASRSSTSDSRTFAA